MHKPAKNGHFGRLNFYRSSDYADLQEYLKTLYGRKQIMYDITLTYPNLKYPTSPRYIYTYRFLKIKSANAYKGEIIVLLKNV